MEDREISHKLEGRMETYACWQAIVLLVCALSCDAGCDSPWHDGGGC